MGKRHLAAFFAVKLEAGAACEDVLRREGRSPGVGVLLSLMGWEKGQRLSCSRAPCSDFSGSACPWQMSIWHFS